MSERVLMTSEDVRRAIVRIAHEIVEQNAGARDLILVGMRTRGVPLAGRLAKAILEFEGETLGVGELEPIEVAVYQLAPPQPQPGPNPGPQPQPVPHIEATGAMPMRSLRWPV